MGMIMEKKSASPNINNNNNTKTNNNISEKSKFDDVEATVKKKHLTGKLEAATLLFKGSVGAGLFAMGDCYKNAGIVGATILLPALAVICVHCEQMLIKGSIFAVEKTPGATVFDYAETVEKCFEYGPKPMRRLSKLMRVIVELFLFVTQFGFCSIYFVFMNENLYQVLRQNGIHVSENMTMLMTLIPVMLPSLMTNLKYISPVSMLANFSLMSGLVCTLGLAFNEGPMPAVAERHLITNGSQMALFFGTALFSYEGIAMILPLRNSMRVPEQFSSRFGVLNLTMAAVTAMFMFTGFVTYLRWGEAVEGSITLNLDVTDIFAQVIKMIAALGVFFGYPLQFFIMIKIIWPPLKRSMTCAQNYPITAQVILRFIMVLLTFGLALVVPKLGLFISLIGALCSTCLAFLIPVLLDFVIRSDTPKALNTWIYLKNIVIILIAIFGIATGSYQSIVEIVRAFKL